MNPNLDMGIWSDDGTIWLPKELYPTRGSAKMFAVEQGADFLEVRVRTCWMYENPEPDIVDMPYQTTNPDRPGAFECWEIT
jgi:hypothetical protein